jgi:hypothetical protein
MLQAAGSSIYDSAWSFFPLLKVQGVNKKSFNNNIFMLLNDSQYI